MFILVKTEDRLADFMASSSLSASAVNIYRGQGNEDKEAPALIIVADNATEEFAGSGIWHVKTEFRVKELASDTSVTSSLADTVFSAFLNDNTKNQLSGSGYYCYDLFVEDTANSRDGDTWIQTVRMDIVCALTT